MHFIWAQVNAKILPKWSLIFNFYLNVEVNKNEL